MNGINTWKKLDSPRLSPRWYAGFFAIFWSTALLLIRLNFGYGKSRQHGTIFTSTTASFCVLDRQQIYKCALGDTEQHLQTTGHRLSDHPTLPDATQSHSGGAGPTLLGVSSPQGTD
ncbi:unnamed protein product [Absidia cylindrospora]